MYTEKVKFIWKEPKGTDEECGQEEFFLAAVRIYFQFACQPCYSFDLEFSRACLQQILLAGFLAEMLEGMQSVYFYGEQKKIIIENQRKGNSK